MQIKLKKLKINQLLIKVKLINLFDNLKPKIKDLENCYKKEEMEDHKRV
jgi:hypothetical protein